MIDAVVDASALVHVLLRTPTSGPVASALFDSGRTLHAPHLVDIEIASALRRLAARREIDPAHGNEMLALLLDMPLRRHAHTTLVARIWQLRDTITADDAVYVALAEALGAPLLTRDGKLAAAARHLIAVELM